MRPSGSNAFIVTIPLEARLLVRRKEIEGANELAAILGNCHHDAALIADHADRKAARVRRRGVQVPPTAAWLHVHAVGSYLRGLESECAHALAYLPINTLIALEGVRT